MYFIHRYFSFLSQRRSLCSLFSSLLDRMGLEHGIYSLGCNWLLFILFFPRGIMNIAAMALLTALIFAEKVFPLGARIAQFAALVLILYGSLLIVAPTALLLSGAGM